MKKDNKETRLLIWTHRAVRWALAGAFFAYGLTHHEDGSWIAIVFGTALLLTSFFRPKRCLEESCTITSNPTNHHQLTTNN